MKLDVTKLLLLKGSAAAAAPKIGGEPPTPTGGIPGIQRIG